MGWRDVRFRTAAFGVAAGVAMGVVLAAATTGHPAQAGASPTECGPLGELNRDLNPGGGPTFGPDVDPCASTTTTPAPTTSATTSTTTATVGSPDPTRRTDAERSDDQGLVWVWLAIPTVLVVALGGALAYTARRRGARGSRPALPAGGPSRPPVWPVPPAIPQPVRACPDRVLAPAGPLPQRPAPPVVQLSAAAASAAAPAVPCQPELRASRPSFRVTSLPAPATLVEPAPTVPAPPTPVPAAPPVPTAAAAQPAAPDLGGGPEAPVVVECPAAAINVLGPVELTVAGRPAGLKPKAVELVAFLALRGGEATPERAVAAMWPDTISRQKGLHNAAWEARKVLGEDLLPQAGAGPYRLSPQVACDYTRFGALTRAGELRAALGLVRGEPLSSRGRLVVGRAGRRADLRGDRCRCRNSRLSGRSRRAMWRPRSGRPAKRCLAAPFDERLYRILMRAADRAGNPQGVTAAWRELVDKLSEPGSPYQPHPDTETLLHQLSR